MTGPRAASGSGCGALLHEALPTEHRPSLGRLERYRRLLAALRAGRAGFGLGEGSAARGGRGGRTQHRDALGFAIFAALGFVLELFVVEEQLLASCEDEVAAAVNTLQNFVLEFHARHP
jgi:hypothetical protein